MAELDGKRAEVLNNAARVIQRRVRTFLARRHFIAMRKAAICIQAHWRGRSCTLRINYVIKGYGVDIYFLYASLQGGLQGRNMRTCGKKLQLFAYKRMCACGKHAMHTERCGKQLSLYRLEFVECLLVRNIDSSGRQRLRLPSRFGPNVFIHVCCHGIHW